MAGKRITIEMDEESKRQLDMMLEDLPKKLAPAEAAALNKSIAHGRSVAADDLSKEMTAARTHVLKRLNILAAKPGYLSAALIIRGGLGVNLIAFHPKQTDTGITATIFGQPQEFPHAFITRGVGKGDPLVAGATGARMVVSRQGDKRAMTMGRYAGRKILRGPRAGQPLLRQPLSTERGPTVAAVWEMTPGIADHTVSETLAAIPKNVQSQIDRFLK